MTFHCPSSMTALFSGRGDVFGNERLVLSKAAVLDVRPVC